MTVPLPLAALATADSLAAKHRIVRSALLTDIVCYHYDRPDLMRHLSQQILFDTRTTTRRVTAATSRPGPHVKVRPPRVIADLIVADYEHRDVGRSALLSDICCHHLGFPEFVRDLHTEKVGLPLAM